MEVFGLIALLILFCYSSYPNKVRKLDRDIKRIKKSTMEESEMSKIIVDLIGKTCKITTTLGIQIVENTVILEADEDWVKIEKTNKKNVKSIKIIRIEDISKIDLVEQWNEHNTKCLNKIDEI